MFSGIGYIKPIIIMSEETSTFPFASEEAAEKALVALAEGPFKAQVHKKPLLEIGVRFMRDNQLASDEHLDALIGRYQISEA